MRGAVTVRSRCLATLLAVLAVLLAALTPSAALAQRDPNNIVHVGWYESPFNTTGLYGRRTGYAYEYQRKIASYTNWTYGYVEGSWPDLLEKVKTGEIDLMSDVTYTEERASQMLFSSYPMGTEEYYLFVVPENAAQALGNPTYFEGNRIGVNKGSVQAGFYEEWAKAHGVTAELVELTNTESESVEAVQSGELDALITIDGYYDPTTIMPVAKVGSSDVYFVVSNKRPDLLAELDAAMSRIQEENRFYNQTLFDKYIRADGANMYLDESELSWLEKHGPINVGYQDNYLAYCAQDSSGELTGALRDYLDEASTCLGNASLTFNPTAYPTSKDALDALRDGEVDCVFPVNLDSYDAEVMGVDVTAPVMEAEVYALVRSSDKRSFSEMEELTTAVVEGNLNYDTLLVDDFSDWKMHTYPNVSACMKAASDGEVDCFLISNYRYNNIIELCEHYNLIALDTGKEIGYCFAIREDEPELYSIISRVEDVVPDTTVNAALTRYFAEEEEVGLVDFVRDNPGMAVAFVAVLAALVVVIIAQQVTIAARRAADESQQQVEGLSKRVYVDALTHVKNKGAFEEYQQGLQERLDGNEPVEFAVGLLDCDDLKLVNDRYGHDKGDEYLKIACHFICRIFQHSPVFRIGGDEFSVILQGEDFENREELQAKFEREMQEICSSTDKPWEQVCISAGFAVYDPDIDGSLEHVVHRADAAMYEKKRARKGSRVR